MHKYFGWFGMPGTIMLSCLLSLTAVILAFSFRTKDRWLCMAAMLLSTVGDIFMDNFMDIGSKIPIPPFFVGAAFFICAHIAYIFVYRTLILEREYTLVNPGFRAAIVFVLVCGVLVIGKSLSGGSVNWGMMALCVVYMCIIGANCACICSFAWSAKSIRSLAALGAVSFFISDLIIGYNVLVGYPGDTIWGLIWWFYPIGQFFMILCA
ncbi:MAG: hypothetical protein IKY52_14190 [Clostridia bacterium]|nr:hypothetical protein [Clostridia bacterium]